MRQPREGYDVTPAMLVLDYLRASPRGFALLGDLVEVVPGAREGVRELLDEQRVAVEDFRSERDGRRLSVVELVPRGQDR